MADPIPPVPMPVPEPVPGWLARNWKFVSAALLVVSWGITAYTAWKKGDPIPPPPIVDVVKQDPDDDAPRPTGWVDEPDEVSAVLAKQPIRAFRFTPAFGAMGETPDHAYLWDAALKVRGSHIPTLDQGSIGSCVANGAETAVEYVMMVAAAQAAVIDPSAWKAISAEVIYGGSRVQIGKGRIRGDGSVGAWAAQWCQQYGVVARGKYDGYDLTAYSVATCYKFGQTGCPVTLEPEAKKHPVKGITLVQTTEELRKALASGYPVTVASNVGFGNSGPYTRDAKGYLRASGTWAHQMCFIGYTRDGDSWGYYCMNSWGTGWVGGPTGPGNPPPGGFWVRESTAQKMLSQGDSWAYSDLVGFQPRKLDWAFAPQPRRELFAAKPFGGLLCDRSFSLSP